MPIGGLPILIGAFIVAAVGVGYVVVLYFGLRRALLKGDMDGDGGGFGARLARRRSECAYDRRVQEQDFDNEP